MGITVGDGVGVGVGVGVGDGMLSISVNIQTLLHSLQFPSESFALTLHDQLPIPKIGV